ncbi:hypothetical protein RISK_001745 [Rhodopirellula islandica]|uniref:Uncharacterized protein n=1 Tax=Rhodopirellula islandica TaxID=595434 RepID=A0A0J1ELW7_RHOIS|nr:hypothetical protein RISK_001745 [Rhodopirellula islandica]
MIRQFSRRPLLWRFKADSSRRRVEADSSVFPQRRSPRQNSA